MPGVPSGRGCNACRKAKKKCDITVDPCPRCARLNLPCIDLGKKRYKFVNDDRSFSVSVRPHSRAVIQPHSRTVSSRSSSPIHDTTILHDLSNEYTWRVSAFADKLKPSIGVKYNLAWTFGAYLLDIPARLGTNEALDRAADAVLAAVDRFSTSLVNVTPVLLEKYALALAALRRCLSDPVKAKASETLCAVMLLMTCHSFLWTPTGPATSHSEGAATIVRLRGRPDNCDHFESNLLLGVRASVASHLSPTLSSVLIVYQLFESLFNDRINFTDQEWIDMYDTKLYELSPEGKAFLDLIRLPNLMRRAKAVLKNPNQCQAELNTLQHEARCLRNNLEPHLSFFRQRLHATEDIAVPDNPQLNPWLGLRNCHYIRAYGLGLASAIFINGVQLDLSAADRSSILEESHQFALDILNLAILASQYRPMGASSLGLCLVAAELGARDSSIKVAVRRLHLEYAKDFRGSEATISSKDMRLVCGWS